MFTLFKRRDTDDIFRNTPILLDEEHLLARFVPWITGVLIFVVLLVLFGMMLSYRLVTTWHSTMEYTWTVQIDGTLTPDKNDAVLKMLRETGGITSVNPLDKDASLALLKPWLGGDLSKDLPIPMLIDIRLDKTQPLDPETLSKRLSAIDPHVTLDTHEQWLGDVSTLMKNFRVLMIALGLLLILGLVLAITLVTRMNFALNQTIIATLHMTGATDRFIAEEFERSTLWLTVKGTSIGLILLISVKVSLYFFGRDEPMLAGLVTPIFPFFETVCVIALSVALIGLSVWASRQTALRRLSKIVT